MISPTLGRTSASLLRLHDYLRRTPLTSPARVAEALGVTAPTVNAALAGVLKEIMGRRWARLYAYQEYIDILAEDTEPFASRQSPG